MKKIYQGTNKNKRKKGKIFFTLFFFVIVLILLNTFDIFFPQSVIRKIFSPFLIMRSVVLSPFNNLRDSFISKNDLVKQVKELKKKNLVLELELLKQRVNAENDSNELGELRYYSDNVEQLKVLVRPPFSPYDTFVVSLKETDSDKIFTRIGAKIYFSGSYIGDIVSIDDKNETAIVKLKSSAGEKTVVRIGELDAEAIGQGGGMFVVSVPKETEIIEGDIITVPELHSAIIGIVKKVEFDEISSFKTLYFSIPISLSGIEFVTMIL
jgi:hypothetical protein